MNTKCSAQLKRTYWHISKETSTQAAVKDSHRTVIWFWQNTSEISSELGQQV